MLKVAFNTISLIRPHQIDVLFDEIAAPIFADFIFGFFLIQKKSFPVQLFPHILLAVNISGSFSRWYWYDNLLNDNYTRDLQNKFAVVRPLCQVCRASGREANVSQKSVL